MNCKSQEYLFEDGLIIDKMSNNPLVHEISTVLGRIKGFKDRVRQYYFEVMLSAFSCPICNGRLHMIGSSRCICECGKILDPTLAFQKSTCCGSRLVRKTFHYACIRCHKPVASRFLFDEKVFDKNYFREMMRESRKKAQQKREEIKRLLADSRSGVLPMMEEPDLDSISGLLHDLDDFIQQSNGRAPFPFYIENSFNMDDYRKHILAILNWNRMLFSRITPFVGDHRRDRVQRFVTLIYMENDREIELTQDDQRYLGSEAL